MRVCQNPSLKCFPSGRIRIVDSLLRCAESNPPERVELKAGSQLPVECVTAGGEFGNEMNGFQSVQLPSPSIREGVACFLQTGMILCIDPELQAKQTPWTLRGPS